MKVSFVRTGERKDRVHVVRADGSEHAFGMHAYGGALPHDVVHFVVEQALELREGFWGRVARGADPERVNAIANRRGGADKYEAFGENLPALMVAEAIVNAPWLREDLDDAALHRAIDDALAEFEEGSAPKLEAADVARVRELVWDWNARWRALATREALDANWSL